MDRFGTGLFQCKRARREYDGAVVAMLRLNPHPAKIEECGPRKIQCTRRGGVEGDPRPLVSGVAENGSGLKGLSVV